MNALLLVPKRSPRNVPERGERCERGEGSKRSTHRFIASVERHSPSAWWVFESEFKRRVALETLMRQMFMRR
ncbi:MAG: hypothetical protein EAZ24_11390 [Burkholderiales bacterium]|nr:MAG: hypothetical protein EAZ24_11390 [Burkholderiales bacterium]TAG79994.1 MAG: hypothetical protein EAZ21_09155 [Betaproteobacteria bacterium]